MLAYQGSTILPSAYCTHMLALQAVMIDEFKRGFEVCSTILPSGGPSAWGRLFEPYKFFEMKTAHYVMVRGAVGAGGWHSG